MALTLVQLANSAIYKTLYSVQQCNGSYMKKISALQEKSPPVEKKMKNEKKKSSNYRALEAFQMIT